MAFFGKGGCVIYYISVKKLVPPPTHWNIETICEDISCDQKVILNTLKSCFIHC